MKKTRLRDNFSKPVQEALAKQVAFTCSRPECRVATLGPSSGGRSSSIGVAAHIRAAAPGGPRFDPTQTQSERSDESNGLWVCHTCSRLIDNDPEAYPVELLRAWKDSAIEAARRQHGARLLTNQDVQDQMASAFKSLPGPMSQNALSNVRVAVEQYLAQLDPRLQFNVSHGPSGTSYHVQAKESVHFRVTMTPEDSDKAHDEWSALIENGRRAALKVKSLAFSGSKALEHIAGSVGAGQMEVHPEGLKLMLRLVSGDRTEKQLAMGSALLTHGTKRYEMTSQLFDGLLTVSLVGPLVVHSPEEPMLNLDVHYRSWQGVDLRLLDSLDAIIQLFETLWTSKEMSLELYDDGKSFIEKVNVKDHLEPIAYHLKWLRYVDMARRFCLHYALCIPFDNEHVVSHAEYEALRNTLSIVDGRHNQENVKAQPIQVTVDLASPLEVSQEGVNIKLDAVLHSNESSVCRLFGHQVEMPPLRAAVESLAHVGVPGTYMPGDSVRLTLPMTQDARVHLYYEEPSAKLHVRKPSDLP